MKLSVSLPEDDVALLDAIVRDEGLPSRSAALRRAIGMLRRSELEEHYATAWDEWAASGEQEVWEATTGDGVSDEPR